MPFNHKLGFAIVAISFSYIALADSASRATEPENTTGSAQEQTQGPSALETSARVVGAFLHGLLQGNTPDNQQDVAQQDRPPRPIEPMMEPRREGESLHDFRARQRQFDHDHKQWVKQDHEWQHQQQANRNNGQNMGQVQNHGNQGGQNQTHNQPGQNKGILPVSLNNKPTNNQNHSAPAQHNEPQKKPVTPSPK